MISLFFLLLSLSYYGQVVRGDCEFKFEDVRSDATIWSHKRVPVYLARLWTGEIEVLNLADEGRTITVQEHQPADNTGYQSLILWCPGAENGVGVANNAAVELKCRDGLFHFSNDEVAEKVRITACVQPTQFPFVIKITNENDLCSSRFVVGFEIDTKLIGEVPKFRELYEVCAEPSQSFHRMDKRDLAPENEQLDQRSHIPVVVPDLPDGLNLVQHPKVTEYDLMTFPGTNVDKRGLQITHLRMYDSISRNAMLPVETYIRSIARESKEGIIEVITKGIPGWLTLPEDRMFYLPLFIAKIFTDKSTNVCSALLVLNRLAWVDEANMYKENCQSEIPPGLSRNIERYPVHVLACSCNTALNF